MRALDKGKSFIVTRNGVPVGELIPLRARVFVPADAVVTVFAGAPRVAATRFRKDVDALNRSGFHATCLTTVLRGLVDTSVVIDLESIDSAHLPSEIAISAMTWWSSSIDAKKTYRSVKNVMSATIS